MREGGACASALVLAVGFGLAATLLPITARAASSEGGVSFVDIAAAPSSGLQYHRTRSTTDALFDAMKARPVVRMADFPFKPLKSRGAPGVALLDYDRDGDPDLYVTNGPGTANSLFRNLWRETGQLRFVDVAVAAGVDATSQDSTGVCFGDIDNDGDPDLYVLGRAESNRLFENLGNGTFREITFRSNAGGGGAYTRTSCAFGDIDNDGRLDLFVANSTSWTTQLAILVEPFALNEPNQLFRNLGDNVFAEVSEAAGIQNIADVTWAATMFDYDEDGDIDLFTANDQGGIATASQGGLDRGFVRLHENDGSGHFTDRTAERGLEIAGGYMGIAVADFDHDDSLDIFVTNVGDWLNRQFGIPYALGEQSTRWFLGSPSGHFTDPGLGANIATPFGWGTAAADYDNDGDTDLIYVGGLDTGPFVEKSNPGVYLRNDGTAQFQPDLGALAGSADHSRRKDQGLAVGDLNLDGFIDVVSVSSFVLPASAPLQPFPFSWNAPLDPLARFCPTFQPTGTPGEFVWTGQTLDDGLLAVEINTGNDLGSVALTPLGAVGLTPDGKVNRDGVGAVLRFTPRGGRTAAQPALGGASYASQHERTMHFGLGDAFRGDLEVLWPGGVVNRFYGLRNGERLVIPEIPCDSAGEWPNLRAYRDCVAQALDDLMEAGVVSPRNRVRFFNSAMQAYREAH